MNWYYALNGQQLGPVDDGQLDALLAAGTVQPDTLVWAEGMPNWQPISQARPPGGGGPALGVACSHCGRSFSPESLIRIADRMVCSECKPVVLQQLQEGVLRPSDRSYEYGGFWIRFAAKFIDNIVLAIPNYALTFGLSLAFFGVLVPQPDPNRMGVYFAFQGFLMLIGFAISMSYSGFFLSKYGSTLGKMACGLKVIRASDGGNLTFWQGAVRVLAEIISSMICLIGYIMAGFDEEKRALHDRMCGTRVVKK